MKISPIECTKSKTIKPYTSRNQIISTGFGHKGFFSRITSQFNVSQHCFRPTGKACKTMNNTSHVIRTASPVMAFWFNLWTNQFAICLHVFHT